MKITKLWLNKQSSQRKSRAASTLVPVASASSTWHSRLCLACPPPSPRCRTADNFHGAGWVRARPVTFLTGHSHCPRTLLLQAAPQLLVFWRVFFVLLKLGYQHCLFMYYFAQVWNSSVPATSSSRFKFNNKRKLPDHSCLLAIKT